MLNKILINALLLIGSVALVDILGSPWCFLGAIVFGFCVGFLEAYLERNKIHTLDKL